MEKQTYHVTVRRMKMGRVFIRATSKEEARKIAKAISLESFPEGTEDLGEHFFNTLAFPIGKTSPQPSPETIIWEVNEPYSPPPPKSMRYNEVHNLRNRINQIRNKRGMNHEMATTDGRITPALANTGAMHSRSQGSG